MVRLRNRRLHTRLQALRAHSEAERLRQLWGTTPITSFKETVSRATRPADGSMDIRSTLMKVRRRLVRLRARAPQRRQLAQ